MRHVQKVNANQKLELMRTFTITIVGYANFSVVRGVHMLGEISRSISWI